jgi:hypothetical protein
MESHWVAKKKPVRAELRFAVVTEVRAWSLAAPA